MAAALAAEDVPTTDETPVNVLEETPPLAPAADDANEAVPVSSDLQSMVPVHILHREDRSSSRAYVAWYPIPGSRSWLVP